MAVPRIFETCTPREDVLQGRVTESDFAADLAQVLKGKGPKVYLDADQFFAHTHPTRGLKNLLRSVLLRLSGHADQIGSIFRLDTKYGGGKTHALIALSHVCRKGGNIEDIAEFVDPGLLIKEDVTVAAFDGENADPANGIHLEGDLRAYTPWGELAYALQGRSGYELVRRSDENGVAPGSGVLTELFADRPTLLLIDELAVYLRKLHAVAKQKAGGQLTAFLTALFKAVESSPYAVVVYTLAVGKEGKASDAYQEENEEIATAMAEAQDEASSISARKATLLDPTEEDETVKVLRRRLFECIDDSKADAVVAAYKKLWEQNVDKLPTTGAGKDRAELLRSGYPLHQEIIETLRSKTSTLANFQRVRGMLRLLARTVADLWEHRPNDAYSVHLHHVNLSNQTIRQEILTRLGQQEYAPAVTYDVAAVEGDQPALAKIIDNKHYMGLPPYTSYVARTVLLHTLAFNEQKKGVSRERLCLAILSPGTEIGFIEDATRRFIEDSGYLDDRPNALIRFLTEININQLIRREERNLDTDEIRAQLNDRIRTIFSGTTFELSPFPSGPHDVPDDPNAANPSLIVIGYDAETIGGDRIGVPDLVQKIFVDKGSSGEVRKNRNNVVFLVADVARKPEMRHKMARRIALSRLREPGRINQLKEHQQEKLQELYQTSDHELAITIQQTYRHLFYASKDHVEGATVDLAHTVIDTQNASANPGAGQKQVERVLRDLSKLRVLGDDPDSPTYIRDKTPLRNGRITTFQLRAEYRKDPALPILVEDDVFVRSLRQGIEHGDFVYQNGDLLWGRGDPWAQITVNEQCFIYTTSYAKEHKIWPRPVVTPSDEDGENPPPTEEVYDGGNDGGGEAQPVTPQEFTAQGTLKESLTQLWEKVRAKSVSKIAELVLSVEDPSDGFKIFGLLGTVPQAEKLVSMEGGYATVESSEFAFEFNGSHSDAQAVKDLLQSQFGAASDRHLSLQVTLRFNNGLSLEEKVPEQLSERLSKLGAGSSSVSVRAKVAE